MLVSQQTIEIKCFYFEMRIPPYQEVKIKGNHAKLKKFIYQNNYGIKLYSSEDCMPADCSKISSKIAFKMLQNLLKMHLIDLPS